MALQSEGSTVDGLASPLPSSSFHLISCTKQYLQSKKKSSPLSIQPQPATSKQSQHPSFKHSLLPSLKSHRLPSYLLPKLSYLPQVPSPTMQFQLSQLTYPVSSQNSPLKSPHLLPSHPHLTTEIPPPIIDRLIQGPYNTKLRKLSVSHNDSARLKCPVCLALVTPTIRYDNGVFTWMSCCLLNILCCCTGCCLIPFCVQAAKDITYVCPDCKQDIAKCRRFG